MRTNRHLTRRVMALAATGVAGLLVFAAPQAQAETTHATADPHQAGRLATTLGSAYGADHTAGSYVDASGTVVVNVTDQATAAKVRAKGATPRLVQRSGAKLDAVKKSMDGAKSLQVPGTSWAVDPKTNQVRLGVDTTVSKAELAKVKDQVAKYGSSVRIAKTGGTYRTKLSGGDAIYGSGYRCSLGFNVTKGGADYFLTAGHCGNDVATWYSDQGESNEVGTTEDSNFPGNDYALVKYTDGGSHPSSVGSVSISGAGTPAVGETVTRRGSTTGTQSGEVTALNATVNYQEGSVSGLIDTTVCAEPGDSGGSLYGGNTAYGLTSGGSGDCTSGGETFFQPVTEALSAEGASIG